MSYFKFKITKVSSKQILSISIVGTISVNPKANKIELTEAIAKLGGILFLLEVAGKLGSL